MQYKSFFFTLLNTLKDVGVSSEKSLYELGLFLIWLRSARALNTQITLESILSSDTALHQAYQEMEIKIPLFKGSQLPQICSPSQINEIIQTFSRAKFPEIAFEYFELMKIEFRQYSDHTPTELSMLMEKLGNVTNQTVYTPFDTSLPLALQALKTAKEVTYECLSEQLKVVSSELMPDLEVIQGDFIKSPGAIKDGKLRQFDVTIMQPPFGLKYTKFADSYDRFPEDVRTGDALSIYHGLTQTKTKLISVTTLGVLFRSGSDKVLREKLVNDSFIDAVVALPERLFNHTGIPTVLLVIDKKRQPSDPIYFLDANQSSLFQQLNRTQVALTGWEKIYEMIKNREKTEYSALKTQEDIVKKDYDLSVKSYVLGQASVTINNLPDSVKLDSIANIIRAQTFKIDPKATNTTEFLEVCLRDISQSGVVQIPEKKLELSGRMKDRAKSQLLKPYDIVLSTKGNIGQVAIVPEGCGNNWIAGQSFHILRLKENSGIAHPCYLYQYLSSKLVQTHLNSITTGSAIPVLKQSSIEELPIQIFEIKKQNDIVENYAKTQAKHQEIERIDKEIANLKQVYWH